MVSVFPWDAADKNKTYAYTASINMNCQHLHFYINFTFRMLVNMHLQKCKRWSLRIMTKLFIQYSSELSQCPVHWHPYSFENATFFLRFQSTLRPLASFSPVHTYTMNWFENDNLPDCACLTHTCSLLFSPAKNVYACSAKMTRDLFRAMSLALRQKSPRNVGESTLFWQWQGCNFLPL